MKMHALSGGRLRLKRRIYFPDADRAETIDVPVSCFLIRHRQGNVLFDSGCHPSVIDDAEARWGGNARVVVPIFSHGQDLVSELNGIGLGPDDIDVVVNSHLHFDHCGCNAFFTKATIVCHARELEAAKAANAAVMGYVAADWDHPMPIDAIEGERDLYGDDRIVLLPLPGHTPGTVGALVGLDRSGSFLLASDAVSLRANLDRNVLPRNTWSAEHLDRTFQEIRRIEAGGVTVVCGHDEAQWHRLKKGGDAYE
jgi:glyoxylase-like metal-dependent hydrolase (beta-lactamase superfamily II)